MHSKMRVVLGQFQTFDEEMAKFALQLGISEIQMNGKDMSHMEERLMNP